MKRIIATLTVIMLISSVTSCDSNCPQKQKSSPTLITRSIAIDDYHSLTASQDIEVQLTSTQHHELFIEMDEKLSDQLKVENHDGHLYLEIPPKRNNLKRAHIHVKAPLPKDVRKLEAHLSARITSLEALQTDNIECNATTTSRIEVAVRCKQASLNANTASQIKAAIQADDCTLEAAQGSTIKGDIRTQSCHAEAHTASQIEAQIQTKDCFLTASSASKIEGDVQVEETCDVKASLSSKIELEGSTKVLNVDVRLSSKADLEGLTAQRGKVVCESASKAEMQSLKGFEFTSSTGSKITCLNKVAPATSCEESNESTN